MAGTFTPPPAAPVTNAVPLPGEPAAPPIPPLPDKDRMTEVSYASISDGEKEVFYRKYGMCKDWAKDVAEHRLAMAPESKPGRAVGAQSAVWSSVTDLPYLTNRSPQPSAPPLPNGTPIDKPAKVASTSRSAIKRIPSAALNPPTPALAKPPTIHLAPPSSDNGMQPIPNDNTKPAAQLTSTRAQRDAYLASATYLPLEMLSELEVPRHQTSQASSKVSGKRIASLLSQRTKSPAESTVQGSRGSDTTIRPPQRSVSANVKSKAEHGKVNSSQISRLRDNLSPFPLERNKTVQAASLRPPLRPTIGERSITTQAQPPRSSRTTTTLRNAIVAPLPPSAVGQLRSDISLLSSTQLQDGALGLSVDPPPKPASEVQNLGSHSSHRSKKTDLQDKADYNDVSAPVHDTRFHTVQDPRSRSATEGANSTQAPVPSAGQVKAQTLGSASSARTARVRPPIDTGTIRSAKPARPLPASHVTTDSRIEQPSLALPPALGSAQSGRSHRSRREPDVTTDDPLPVPPTSSPTHEIGPPESSNNDVRAPHRQQLPLPRPALSRSISSLSGLKTLGRRHRDPSSANLTARFEPAMYPLPPSGPSGTETDTLVSPTKVDENDMILPKARSHSRSQRTPNILGNHSGNHTPSSRSGEKDRDVLPPTHPDSPYPLLPSPRHAAPVERSSPGNSTIIIPTSPPSGLSPDTEHLTFEVPSGSRGRLRVSLAWFRDGGISERRRRREGRSTLGSPVPPPVPSKSPPPIHRHLRPPSPLVRKNSTKSSIASQRRDREEGSDQAARQEQYERPRSPQSLSPIPPPSIASPIPHIQPQMPMFGWPSTPMLPYGGGSPYTPQFPPNPYAYPQPTLQHGMYGTWPYTAPNAQTIPPSQFGRPIIPPSRAPPSPPRPPSIEPPSSRGSPPPLPPAPLGMGYNTFPPNPTVVGGGRAWWMSNGQNSNPRGNGVFSRFFSRGRRQNERDWDNTGEDRSINLWRRNVAPSAGPPPTRNNAPTLSRTIFPGRQYPTNRQNAPDNEGTGLFNWGRRREGYGMRNGLRTPPADFPRIGSNDTKGGGGLFSGLNTFNRGRSARYGQNENGKVNMNTQQPTQPLRTDPYFTDRQRAKEDRRRAKTERRDRRQARSKENAQKDHQHPNGYTQNGHTGQYPQLNMQARNQGFGVLSLWPNMGVRKQQNPAGNGDNNRGFSIRPQRQQASLRPAQGSNRIDGGMRDQRGRIHGMVKGWVESLRPNLRRQGIQRRDNQAMYGQSRINGLPYRDGRAGQGQQGIENGVTRKLSNRKWSDRAKGMRRK